MKKINATLIAVIAASLILVAGCYTEDPTMPDVIGYDGYLSAGWVAFEAGDYESAMDNFQFAIEIDTSRPDAYLGAGWCAVLLPDYWVIGEQYDYMAVQLDDGVWPVKMHTGAQAQDLSWSVFQCTYPVLTDNDLLVINSFGTTDTLIIDDTLVVFEPSPEKLSMDNLEIGDWLFDVYGSIRFQYTFEIENPNITSMFVVNNGFALRDSAVDSIVNGATSSTIYLSVPYKYVEVGEANYRTWCMNANNMTYEYATYESAAGHTAFANDAVAAYGLLQNIRGENGDVLLGSAALLGLAEEEPYTFSHYAGITSLKMKGMAAAMAYSNQYFRPALGICRSEGFGLDIEMSDSDFLVKLMQAIEMMLL